MVMWPGRGTDVSESGMARTSGLGNAALGLEGRIPWSLRSRDDPQEGGGNGLTKGLEIMTRIRQVASASLPSFRALCERR